MEAFKLNKIFWIFTDITCPNVLCPDYGITEMGNIAGNGLLLLPCRHLVTVCKDSKMKG